ncbi:hypothetical protein F7018_13270 [Tenacibaculum aiptasiae]|uniref:Tetratricopeptide repeat protein n=1 Tax=Tenacibaculum aiptasiae TaxID=426481 RepID=A0A7J5AAB1_9FLAO|nr:hypothetical protein [Tenacibaculum aiptasiae]KAB1154501.1 hypothetical protein F7018_13270 [Tenacibaculum aiptasiae]
MNLEDDILIERFLRKELSNEERTNFLKRIEIDEAFKECFLLEKRLLESFNDNDWSFAQNITSKEVEEYTELFRSEKGVSLKNTISEVNAIYKKESQSKKRKLFYISGIAATIVLLIVINLFKEDNNSTDYYNEYIMLNELPSFINRGEASEIKKLVSAENYFKKKEYKEVLSNLNKISNLKLKDGNYYVYKGISLIELKKYDKAEKTLDTLISGDLLDAQKGYWYKSLLFIKANQLDKAKKELKFIIENNYFKHKEAKELLTKLD